MNKGFTLVELLAVIILLAAILLIAIPAYNNVSVSIKTKSLEQKEKAIAASMLKYVTTYLLDEVKPANNKCLVATDCCKKYDLNKFILENGVYASEEVKAGVNIIINPLTNNKLTGCIIVTYNTSTLGVDVSFDKTCVMTTDRESC